MPKIETIMTVANVIFGDTKNLNWGRIVALFYFALEMCVRAIKYMVTKDGILAWIKDLVVQVAVFIVRQFGNWIMQQGGWNAIVEYHVNHPNPALVTVIAVAAVVGIYFIYMSRRK